MINDEPGSNAFILTHLKCNKQLSRPGAMAAKCSRAEAACFSHDQEPISAPNLHNQPVARVPRKGKKKRDSFILIAKLCSCWYFGSFNFDESVFLFTVKSSPTLIAIEKEGSHKLECVFEISQIH